MINDSDEDIIFGMDFEEPSLSKLIDSKSEDSDWELNFDVTPVFPSANEDNGCDFESKKPELSIGTSMTKVCKKAKKVQILIASSDSVRHCLD